MPKGSRRDLRRRAKATIHQPVEAIAAVVRAVRAKPLDGRFPPSVRGAASEELVHRALSVQLDEFPVLVRSERRPAAGVPQAHQLRPVHRTPSTPWGCPGAALAGSPGATPRAGGCSPRCTSP
eukprot:scaffold1720_cov238-Pinguiococcus_pyrenoidosus.AAC.13